MVSEEEVVKAAEIESGRIIDEAKREAETFGKSISISAEMLMKLDENDRALQVVRRGVEEAGEDFYFTPLIRMNTSCTRRKNHTVMEIPKHYGHYREKSCK